MKRKAFNYVGNKLANRAFTFISLPFLVGAILSVPQNARSQNYSLEETQKPIKTDNWLINGYDNAEVVKGYAERTYRQFSEISKGEVTFTVREKASGSLSDIKGLSISSLIARPSLELLYEYDGDFVTPRSFRLASYHDKYGIFAPTTSGEMLAKNFVESNVAYRVLSIEVSVKGVTTNYDSVELCGLESARCDVIDPVVYSLASDVDNIKNTPVSHEPVLSYDSLTPEQKALTKAAPHGCFIASTYGTTNLPFKPYPKAARSVRRGSATLGGVRMAIGKSNVVFTCNSQCKIVATGQADGSSAHGIGVTAYHHKCDIIPNIKSGGGWQSGTTSYIRAGVATGCAYGTSSGLTANYKYFGTGGDFTIKWDSTRASGTDGNDTVYQEACDRFGTR